MDRRALTRALSVSSAWKAKAASRCRSLTRCPALPRPWYCPFSPRSRYGRLWTLRFISAAVRSSYAFRRLAVGHAAVGRAPAPDIGMARLMKGVVVRVSFSERRVPRRDARVCGLRDRACRQCGSKRRSQKKCSHHRLYDFPLHKIANAIAAFASSLEVLSPGFKGLFVRRQSRTREGGAQNGEAVKPVFHLPPQAGRGRSASALRVRGILNKRFGDDFKNA
jgi:hypothetical protein